MKYLEARRIWEAQRAVRAAEKDKTKALRPVYEDKMLRPADLEDKAEEPEEAEPEPGTVIDTPEDVVEWPLRIHPASYLGLHPTGQWADTARQLLADEKTDG